MTKSCTVVAWDGSPGASGALEWAATREERHGGAVHVVRVLDPQGAGEPSVRVTEARAELERAVADVGSRWPDLRTTAALVVGDPVAELSRAAGYERLLVLGASPIGRTRRRDARRIPIALAARPIGTTAVIPADAPEEGGGVLGIVSGRPRSRATIDFAVDAALERQEPLTLVRLHDPHDLDVDADRAHMEREIERLRLQHPGLGVRLASGWVGSPYGLLGRSDGASLLVLEGRRPSAAPPRYSLERWLAGQTRVPFVVVAETALVPGTAHDRPDASLALTV